MLVCWKPRTILRWLRGGGTVAWCDRHTVAINYSRCQSGEGAVVSGYERGTAKGFEVELTRSLEWRATGSVIAGSSDTKKL